MRENHEGPQETTHQSPAILALASVDDARVQVPAEESEAHARLYGRVRPQVPQVESHTKTPTPPKPRILRKSRREQVLLAASEMFAELGYHGASLRRISRQAGISHPGMLHHFATKEALLDGVVDLMEAHAQSALDQLDDLKAGPHSLRKALNNTWNPTSHTIQLFAMLYTDAVSEEHPGRFRLVRLRLVHENVLEQCFTAYEAQGYLRDGMDPAFASRAMMDLILGHAVRERTVRAIQQDSYDDAPRTDLDKLLIALLNTS